MFALQNTPDAASQPSELLIRPVDVKTAQAQFDLALDVTEDRGQLHLSLVYNTDLFDATTVRRMLRHFQTLLESIVANPEQKIYELPLLDENEARQLLIDWNNNPTEDSPNTCVHEMFEAQVERAPHSVAVMFEDEQLTYS